MKRFLKIFSALTMIILILAASVMPSFAAGELAVNGATAQKDDVITYTLKLADCEEAVVGFQMYIKYDKEYLEMVEDSLAFPELSSSAFHNGSIQSTSEDGIIFNYSNVQTPDDFSVEKVFATVDFKVLKGGETNIEFFVGDLFGMDMTYMKSYTFTYNLSVNEEPVIEGEPPLLVDDQEYLVDKQGQFINYVDGKGEENGKADGENATRETVMGVTTAPSTPIDVLKGTEEDDSMDVTTIIVLIAVVLIVLIIVVLIIVRNALNRSKKEEVTSESEKTE